MRASWKGPVAAAVCGSVTLLGACSGSSGDGGSGSSPPATPTETSTQFASIPGAEAFPAGEPIDLVHLRDSADAGVAYAYADLAAEALGREVRVHDHYIGGISDIQAAVHGTWSDEVAPGEIADEVAQAGIVLVYGNTAGLDPPQTMDTCIDAVGAEAPAEPPVIASADDWQPAIDVLDDIYATIWELRQGRPTIIRTHDFYDPFLAPWTELGIQRECAADWEALSEALSGAADTNGVGFASLLDVFNGPAHDQDPRDKGWISEDGAHPSGDGAEVIAETLASVGFDASQPLAR